MLHVANRLPLRPGAFLALLALLVRLCLPGLHEHGQQPPALVGSAAATASCACASLPLPLSGDLGDLGDLGDTEPDRIDLGPTGTHECLACEVELSTPGHLPPLPPPLPSPAPSAWLPRRPGRTAHAASSVAQPPARAPPTTTA